MEDEEENNNGDPVLINFDDGVEVGEETGGDLQNPDNTVAQEQYDGALDLDMSTQVPLEELDKKTKAVDSDTKVKDILPTWMKKELREEEEQLKIDEKNLFGNKYSDYNDILTSISSDNNKKTLELLALGYTDYLDINEGVVTNKQGEVVETKKDFIKATGLDGSKEIFELTSQAFKNKEMLEIELNVERANNAWLYLKSSYERESGNNIMSLFGQGEEQTLDFDRFEEEMKIEVLNQLSIDQFELSVNEGRLVVEGENKYEGLGPSILYGNEFNVWRTSNINTGVSLEMKEMIITNAKAAVLGNQMKIQTSAANNLKVIEDDYIIKNKKLENDYAALESIQEGMQNNINELNSKHGTWSWDSSGRRKYISYGDIRDWSEADKSKLKSINADIKRIGIDNTLFQRDREEVLGLQKTYEDSARNFHATNQELFEIFLYDNVNNKFKPAFKQTITNKVFNEVVKNSSRYMGPVLDVAFTGADGVGKYIASNAVFSSIAVIPAVVTTAVVGAVDYSTDYFQGGLDINRKEPHGYSRGEDRKTMPFMSDMLNTLLDISTSRILPVSASGSIKIEGYESKSDNWLGRAYDNMLGEGANLTMYSGSKTIADLFGYMGALGYSMRGLVAKHSARTLKLKMAQVVSSQGSLKSKLGAGIARSLEKGFVGSRRFTESVEMTKSTMRMLTLDNIADGKAQGLSDFQAVAYGNALSFFTGVSQSIMPDYQWFRTPGGKSILSQLTKGLRKKNITQIETRNAIRIATKQFAKNFFKEQLEEQVDLAFSDVVKLGFIAGHSPDILKAEVQAEVLRGTTLLTGSVGSIQSRKTYKTVRSMTNRAFYHDAIDIIAQGQRQIKTLEDKAKTLGIPKRAKDIEFKKLLEKDIAALKQNVSDARDRSRAINAAPNQVTDEQIDLLLQKNKLIDDRGKLNKKDKALVSEELEVINKQISDLDAKIKEATPVKYKESVAKALLKNAKKLATSMGVDIDHFTLPEEDYDKAMEEEILRRSNINKKIDDKIAQIDGSTPEGKKKITQEEAKKQIIPTYDDPGLIYYDDITKKHRILINETAAKKGHNEAVVLHELFHAVLRQTIIKTPGKVKALSFMMKQELLKNPEKYSYILGKFEAYPEVVNNMAFDELFTVFSEAIIQGDVKIESTLGSKISDFIRRLLMEVGINFSVSGPEGMIKFIRDYNNEVMSGRDKFSRGMQKIIDNGLNIKASQQTVDNIEAVERLMIQAKDNKITRIFESGANVFQEGIAEEAFKVGDKKTVSRSIKTKATTKSVYDQKKLVNDLKLSESTAKIVEENAKIREIILEEGLKSGNKIVASEDLQNKLVENNLALAVSLATFAARNPNIMGLEAGKRVSAQQFISGYYLQLSNLARTYDASVNEFGQYLNTILPLRYGQILEAEKAGAVEGSVGLDEAKEIVDDADLTPDDVVVGPTVDTAERLGIKEETKPFVDAKIKQAKKLLALREKISENYNEETAEQIAELELEGAADLDMDSVTVKQAPNLLYEFTSKLFGIDADKLNPKSTKWLANLRKDDKRGSNEVRSAQRAVVKNVQLILSTIFNDGHTKAHKSSGMPNSLLKFGYNKSSKRIGNGFPQYKKPNLSEKDLLEFIGVFKVKGKYEFKVDRNTGTKLIAIASMVDRNMSLQAINENLKESGDITAKLKLSLEDGMSKASKSIYYIENLNLQPTIDAGLASIATKIENLIIILKLLLRCKFKEKLYVKIFLYYCQLKILKTRTAEVLKQKTIYLPLKE